MDLHMAPMSNSSLPLHAADLYTGARDEQKLLISELLAVLKPSARTDLVPNFSRVLSSGYQADSVGMPSQNTSTRSSSTIGVRKGANVKRFGECSQVTSAWDGLRHDAELWSQDGDCQVHLYGEGKSKRAPSFQISSVELVALDCAPLLSTATVHTIAARGVSENDSLSLYIPAPGDVLREDTFEWHLTTRNFFAWLCGKPLVGATLGESLVSLYERMRVFRSAGVDNVHDCLEYAQKLGYMDFNDHPDYALAFLHFAEHVQSQELWVDAFAHCVGMNNKIGRSPEFQSISRVTKAMITRAYLEMDLHLGRVSRALRTFLDEELSPTHFGLSAGAKAHLDRFRSFLHSFYVNKFGYWPPEKKSVFSKTLLQSMYSEFHNLYEYLVDKDSTASMQGKPAIGGICVLQNVNAFNERHNHEALPHPLPLLPEYEDTDGKTPSQRGLRAFKLGSKPTEFERRMTVRSALAMATNTLDSADMTCPLLKDYISFEREWSARPEEKVSVVDARKVRWIVVYSILQMIASVTRAPKEVRESSETRYHLCLLTTAIPPWGNAPRAPKPIRSFTSPDVTSFVLQPVPAGEAQEQAEVERSSSPLSIHPDCEADDYFSKTTMHTRSTSGTSLRPAPLRVNTAPARTGSIRSLSRSVMSNLSLHSRRSSTNKSPTVLSHIDIFAPSSQTNIDLNLGDELRSGARTPTLDDLMLDRPAGPGTPGSTSSASESASHTFYSASMSTASWNRDDADRYSCSSNEDPNASSSDRYSMEHESVMSRSSSRKCSGTSSPTSSAAASWHTTNTSLSTSASTNLSQHARNFSTASSVYPEAPMQASDIDVTETQRLSQMLHARDLIEAQTMGLSIWWPETLPAPRPCTAAPPIPPRLDKWQFGFSVPEDVPEEDEEMVWSRGCGKRESIFGFASTLAKVDIEDALAMLPAHVAVKE